MCCYRHCCTRDFNCVITGFEKIERGKFKKIERTTIMNTPKLAGSTLIIASVMLIVGFVLHPMPKEAGIEALARNMVESLEGLWYPVHVIVLLAFPILMFGFLILYRIAVSRGEQIYSLPAILSLGLVTVFATLGIVME